jgi:hypothetical protein
LLVPIGPAEDDQFPAAHQPSLERPALLCAHARGIGTPPQDSPHALIARPALGELLDLYVNNRKRRPLLEGDPQRQRALAPRLAHVFGEVGEFPCGVAEHDLQGSAHALDGKIKGEVLARLGAKGQRSVHALKRAAFGALEDLKDDRSGYPIVPDGDNDGCKRFGEELSA